MRLSLLNVLLIALGAIVLNNPLLGSEIRVWGPATSCPEVLTVPAGLTDVVQIAGGMRHIVALKGDGTVVAWGKNDEGQLNVPVGLTGVVKIVVAANSNMAIRADGTFAVWGQNNSQQLTTPADITNIKNAALSFFDAVAIMPNGSLRHWGDHALGVLPVVSTAVEVGVEGGIGFVRLADNSVQMWTSAFQPVGREALFVMPVGLQAKKLIGPFGEIVLAITPAGKLECWGVDTALVSAAPTSQLTSNVIDGAIGSSHILVLKGDGSMVTWTSRPSDATALEIPTNWTDPTDIACGFQFSVGLWSIHAPNGSNPNNISLSSSKFHPGSMVGTTIGTLSAQDGDPGDQHTFVLTSGSGDTDNAVFQILDNVLSAAQAIPPTASTFSIRVNVIDSGGLTFEKSFQITSDTSAQSPSTNTGNNSNSTNQCGLGGSTIALFFLMIFAIRKSPTKR